MKTIELVTRCLMQLVVAAAIAFICVRGLTGCRYLASPEAKAKVVESLKTAYAEGNALTNRVCDSSGRSRSDVEDARQGPRRTAVSILNAIKEIFQ